MIWTPARQRAVVQRVSREPHSQNFDKQARRVADYAPGLLLCGLLAWAATAAAEAGKAWGFRASPDAVVLALIAGVILAALWRRPAALEPGIDLSAKQGLEIAIVLLGCTTDLAWLARAGLPLAAAVVVVTSLALGAGWLISRFFGLPSSHALLVTSGNAICGNSAIAAVATVTRAPRDQVASSLAFTAILSIAVVLLLPMLVPLLSLSHAEYGVVAGLTVYAVPQVLAATFPVSAEAGEIATIVKLTRVLMLVPWLAVLAWQQRRASSEVAAVAGGILPWYLYGFLIAAALRTGGLIPIDFASHAQRASHVLTIAAMGALGLGVELGALKKSGVRSASAAVVSFLALLTFALIALQLLPI